jgi:small subunit ribosomal protein S6
LKKYEAILILDDRKVEGNGSAKVKEVEDVIAELGGADISSECMGRKQFAYPIKKKTAGTYWDIFFTADEATNAKVLDRFRLDQDVLRLVIFTYERPEKTQLDLNKEPVE